MKGNKRGEKGRGKRKEVGKKEKLSGIIPPHSFRVFLNFVWKF